MDGANNTRLDEPAAEPIAGCIKGSSAVAGAEPWRLDFHGLRGRQWAIDSSWHGSSRFVPFAGRRDQCAILGLVEQSCGCQPTRLRSWAMARQGGPLLNHQRQGPWYLGGSVGFAATRCGPAPLERYPVPCTPFLAPDHAPPASRLGAKEDPPCRTNEMVPGRRRALAALPSTTPRRGPGPASPAHLPRRQFDISVECRRRSWQFVCSLLSRASRSGPRCSQMACPRPPALARHPKCHHDLNFPQPES